MWDPLQLQRRKSHMLGILPLVLLFACVFSGPWTSRATAFDPWWVQVHTDTQLWSGPDDNAVSFGAAPAGSSLLVIAPQQGPRLYVQNPATGNVAYVDAAAVGPGGPPGKSAAITAAPSSPAGLKRTPPKTPVGFAPFWVANFEPTDLWSGPEKWAISLGKVPQFRRFLVIEPQKGDRLAVWSPETDRTGYLDTTNIGPVGPSVWLEPHPLKITRDLNIAGRAVGDSAYVRNLPLISDETELQHLANNAPVQVQSAGVAPDGTEWYTVGDGRYISSKEVRLPSQPPAYLEGKWIDADINQPAMITAYDGDQVVYTAMVIIGTEATPTLRGTFQILRRVDDEIMDSSTLGIPKDSPEGYFLKDVLYTQYFTPQGAAIHYNYWIGTFGRPGSHGCLGLSLEDAKWFWDWASVGTPVVVR